MFGLVKSRSARWMLGFALCVGAVAPWAAAREENVELEKVPVHIRKEIEKGTRGGKHVVVIRVADEERPVEDFFVRYELDGKEMKMRITANGKILEHGETRAQRHKDEEARLAQAKNEEERARILAALSAQREAEDRAAFEAQKAALEAQAAREAAAHPNAPAAPVMPAMLALRELSEEWNSTDRRPCSYDELPPKVKVLFDNESRGLKHVDYFKYTVAGKPFYSCHYDTGADRRIVLRAQPDGLIAGKHELTGAAEAADESEAIHKGR